MRRLLVCTLALLVVSAPSAALATPEDVANDISTRVMSPFCPGVTLHECSSREALDLRAQIERWAAAGWDEARIMERLEAEYSENIRATPPTEGRGLLAWVLPGLVAVGGLAFAAVLARRWSLRRADDLARADETKLSLAPAQLERVNRELAAREAQLHRGTP